MEKKQEHRDIYERLAILETSLSVIEKNTNRILENHLPHIQAGINKINIRLAYYGGGIVIIGWLLNHYAK
jgi:Mg2+ and Co2+ transporter CorA